MAAKKETPGEIELLQHLLVLPITTNVSEGSDAMHPVEVDAGLLRLEDRVDLLHDDGGRFQKNDEQLN